MKTVRNLTLLFLAWLAMGQTFAQSYYPGGLGKANLVIWLDANIASSVTRNGYDQVSKWSDLSGNGNSFIQSTNSRKPVYSATGNPDGNPGIGFDADNSQYLALGTLSSSYSFAGGVSAFAQASYSATETSWGWQRIFDFGNGTSNDNFMMGRYGATSNTYYEGWNNNSGDQTYTTSNPITNNRENIFEAIQSGGTPGHLTNVAQYTAGAAQAVDGAAGTSKTYLPASLTRSNNYLGRSNWSSDDYFSGTMSELLIYNTAVNTTQRVILENYLSAEWGKAVGVQKYNAPGGAYGTNLVGIGYTSSSDYFTTDVSGSTDGLGFTSGTGSLDFLKTAGYVMAAHNGQANTVITPGNVPGITSSGTLARWNRSWYVMKSGGNSTGFVTFQFNFPDYNGSTVNRNNTFALLYNATDGSFATGTNKLITTASTSTTTTVVSFEITATNLATGYYTVLYSTAPIVLPVTLSSFTASAQGNTALLQWSASQTAALGKFSIERSADGTNFSTIAAVTAATDAATAEQYTFTDNGPLAGVNYYRLAMVDRDGTAAWSGIRSVSFAAGSSAPVVTVYPNPVVNQLHLTLTDATGAIAIRLLNSQGQPLRTISAVAPATLEIPVNGLARGIYFLAIDGSNGHYVREIFKD
ncbi:MAG TPA: T9SS type A sorting domain-containing protein [Puia sp.]|nr:T9SS type A sorting domain-containing protein [Puia sp.]